MIRRTVGWVENGRQEFSDGLCAPVLWGVRLGYAIDEIAAGLEISEALVCDVIESRSPVRFPRLVTGEFVALPACLNVWEKVG